MSKVTDNKTENKTPNKYAVLMETNGKEYESWYYFIKYNGNEEELKHLAKQLESIDFYIMDDLSTFDIDLEHLVSETTAKEMTKCELNALMFHRKFDGKLQHIDLGFKKRDSNDKKIVRCFKKLGIGRIDDFIDGEDIDPEDLKDGESSGQVDTDSESDNDYHYDISDSDESDEETGKDRDKDKKKDKRDDKRRKEESESENDETDSEEEERKKKRKEKTKDKKKEEKLEKLKKKMKD